MSEDFEVRAVDGRVLCYGCEADDALDLDHRSYEVNRRLDPQRVARLSFDAGYKAAQHSSRIPFVGSTDT